MRQAIAYLDDASHDELVELARVNRWSVSATLAWIVEQHFRATDAREMAKERA